MPSLLASTKFLLVSDITNSVTPFESRVWWKIAINTAINPGGMKAKRSDMK